MSDWEVSPALEPLIKDVEAEYPGITVGTIGNQAHQAEGTASDHNPDEWGFVCAADFMIDEGGGFTAADAQALATRLVVLKDPRTAYIIYNRRIISRTVDAWVWRTYDGEDPHTNHVHVSVNHSATPRPTTTWDVYPKVVDDVALTPDDKAFIVQSVKDLLTDQLGSSGPNVGQDLERTEAIQADTQNILTVVKDIQTKVTPAS